MISKISDLGIKKIIVIEAALTCFMFVWCGCEIKGLSIMHFIHVIRLIVFAYLIIWGTKLNIITDKNNLLCPIAIYRYAPLVMIGIPSFVYGVIDFIKLIIEKEFLDNSMNICGGIFMLYIGCRAVEIFKENEGKYLK